MPIKNELDNGNLTKYKKKFIDIFRFMSKSLLSIFKYLSERIHGDKCTDCRSYLYYMSVIRKTLIKN